MNSCQKQIVMDCRGQLSSGSIRSAFPEAAFLLEAIDAIEDGHATAAQALLTVTLDSLIRKLITDKSERGEITNQKDNILRMKMLFVRRSLGFQSGMRMRRSTFGKGMRSLGTFRAMRRSMQSGSANILKETVSRFYCLSRVFWSTHPQRKRNIGEFWIDYPVQ